MRTAKAVEVDIDCMPSNPGATKTAVSTAETPIKSYGHPQ